MHGYGSMRHKICQAIFSTIPQNSLAPPLAPLGGLGDGRGKGGNPPGQSGTERSSSPQVTAKNPGVGKKSNGAERRRSRIPRERGIPHTRMGPHAGPGEGGTRNEGTNTEGYRGGGEMPGPALWGAFAEWPSCAAFLRLFRRLTEGETLSARCPPSASRECGRFLALPRAIDLRTRLSCSDAPARPRQRRRHRRHKAIDKQPAVIGGVRRR